MQTINNLSQHQKNRIFQEASHVKRFLGNSLYFKTINHTLKRKKDRMFDDILTDGYRGLLEVM